MENILPKTMTLCDMESSACSDKLLIEQFLMEHFVFRRNELSGKVEFMVIDENAADKAAFRPLTTAAMNSILRKVEIALPDAAGHKHHVEMFVFSEETASFDPAKEWLESLPDWDGENHVADLLMRIPGITSEQVYWMNVWMRSAVAHWLGYDTMHGNECVPTLIGAQGCGKSTFCQRLLPSHLRQYYLDHINLSNKNDKEMALTSNLLVNIDELDQIRNSQHSELKQTLSKVKVNGRPIYGRAQLDRKRFASFVATTNNPHPLNDPTGSRRYICIHIPNGKLIDNDTAIDYDQLYAQILHEVKDETKRYWFTNEETMEIQKSNIQYQNKPDIDDMLEACFRRPYSDEKAKAMSLGEISSIISTQYPLLKINHATKIRLGLMLKEQGYEQKVEHNRRLYFAVPTNGMKHPRKRVSVG